MAATRPSYYGAFFWITLLSFSVPLVVAARAFHEVKLTTKPTPHPDASGVDHALWDYLLKSYVSSGLVDYDGMKRDHLFRVYLRQLAAADLSKLTTAADQLALLCNAYNAFVIDGVITHKIDDSVMNYSQDGKEFFDIEEHIFAGSTVSLNSIEHELIRKRFREPRIHVALVCAARSCPAIRPEAYIGPRLAQQLDDQSIQFANSEKYVQFDELGNKLMVSPLLNWYGDDWQPVGGFLPWLAERIRDAHLVQRIKKASEGQVEVGFLDYDWSLNSQAPTSSREGVATPAKKAEFGSGSIPNE